MGYHWGSPAQRHVETARDVVKDLRFKDKNKDLRLEDKDKDLKSEDKDKEKDF